MTMERLRKSFCLALQNNLLYNCHRHLEKPLLEFDSICNIFFCYMV